MSTDDFGEQEHGSAAQPDAESHSAADAQVERQGLPWEREGGGQLAAAVETLRLVLTEPARAFRMMRQVGGLGDPTLYVAVLGTVGTFFALIWRSMFEGWTASMMGDELAAFTGAGGIGMWSLVLAPFMMVVLTAIGALIYHLALLLFGGAPQPLETTYRVVAYVWGSTSLIQIVPMCGGIIAFVWGSVVMIIGIREAHGVPQSRALAAVLVPVVVVCLCGFFLSSAFTAILLGAGQIT